MRFDVSEMKTVNECGRKWELSSRNAYHMRPKVTNPNLFFGSLFHECLHTLYLGGNIDKVINQAVKECQGDPTQQKVIEAMLRGYYDEVLLHDLEEYKVLDIEHRVDFYLPDFIVFADEIGGEIDENESTKVCGSIDMICLRKSDNTIWGFEHKTASKFRPDIYVAMDEQPRVYYIELVQYVNRLNEKAGEAKYKVGGIYINEVKKVQRKFEYMRRACVYSEVQQAKFMERLNAAAMRIHDMRMGLEHGCGCHMNPGYMSCSMCDYAAICQTYGYADLDKEAILDEFAEEFEVRECDHLDEKTERKIEG